jgi:hypothetical protein
MMTLYHAANAAVIGEIVIVVELLILIVQRRRML